MSEPGGEGALVETVRATLQRLGDRARERAGASAPSLVRVRPAGTVVAVADAVVRAGGLGGVAYEELVAFETGAEGLALDLERDRVGCILLGPSAGIEVGQEVRPTGRRVDVPVGRGLLGRVVDPVGAPLDGKGPIEADGRFALERPTLGLHERAPVERPLHTGITAIDALIPIGRGQRELIIGDRRTGKSAVALQAASAAAAAGVRVVYVMIGQQSAVTAGVVARLARAGTLENAVVVAADAATGLGLQYLAPYAGSSIAEWFMEQGEDALIVYDDLTRHAGVYRELSLLLRRPPGREAYPGDIFYLHSRLLERSARAAPSRGGGSVTALPIVETQAGNLAAYIPTNLVSITDGQIVLDAALFNEDVRPAVDVGLSVSRVGGKAQLPAVKAVGGKLRLQYSRFLELEIFSRFGTKVDESTERALARGRRLRELLRQGRDEMRSAARHVIGLIAVQSGRLDPVAVDDVSGAAEAVLDRFAARAPSLVEDLEQGTAWTPRHDEELDGSVADVIGAFATAEKPEEKGA